MLPRRGFRPGSAGAASGELPVLAHGERPWHAGVTPPIALPVPTLPINWRIVLLVIAIITVSFGGGIGWLVRLHSRRPAAYKAVINAYTQVVHGKSGYTGYKVVPSASAAAAATTAPAKVPKVEPSPPPFEEPEMGHAPPPPSPSAPRCSTSSCHRIPRGSTGSS